MALIDTSGSRGRGIGSKFVKLNFSISGSTSKAWSFSIFFFLLPLSLATILTSFTILSMNTCWPAMAARRNRHSWPPCNNPKYSTPFYNCVVKQKICAVEGRRRNLETEEELQWCWLSLVRCPELLNCLIRLPQTEVGFMVTLVDTKFGVGCSLLLWKFGLPVVGKKSTPLNSFRISSITL